MLDRLAPEQVARSQDATLRHRRDGTAYRLFLKEQQGQWRPPKRVAPRESHLDSRLKSVFALRMEMAPASHDAFLEAVEAGTFERFRERMAPLIAAHERYLRHKPLLRRLLSRAKRAVRLSWRRGL